MMNFDLVNVAWVVLNLTSWGLLLLSAYYGLSASYSSEYVYDTLSKNNWTLDVVPYVGKYLHENLFNRPDSTSNWYLSAGLLFSALLSTWAELYVYRFKQSGKCDEKCGTKCDTKCGTQCETQCNAECNNKCD